MGRPEQRERERKRSAKFCKSLDSFFLSKNVAIPFLDHILFNLDSRFSPLSTTATSLLTLVPAIICARNVQWTRQCNYHNDLPSPELVPQKIIRWKLQYENLPPDKRPSTVAAAIKECDPLYFPNIRVLLKIACTIPVTSCECEWSASKLRRLHTYMHASMAQEMLTSLSIATYSLWKRHKSWRSCRYLH